MPKLSGVKAARAIGENSRARIFSGRSFPTNLHHEIRKIVIIDPPPATGSFQEHPNRVSCFRCCRTRRRSRHDRPGVKDSFKRAAAHRVGIISALLPRAWPLKLAHRAQVLAQST